MTRWLEILWHLFVSIVLVGTILGNSFLTLGIERLIALCYLDAFVSLRVVLGPAKR